MGARVQRRMAMIGVGLIVLLLAAGAGALPASADVSSFEVAEYREDFEVPKQQAEESLGVQADGAKAGIVEGLEERLGSDYAGVWFDNETGEFVVPLLPSRGGAEVGSQFAAADLSGGDFRTTSAQFTWEELQAAQAEVDDALSSLREEQLVQTSIDPRTNAVAVVLAEGMDAVERAQVQDLVARAGGKVEVRQAGTDRLHFTTESCYFDPGVCGAPLRGGVNIAPFGATVVGPGCTAGFKATGKTNGRRYVLTAGHCVPGTNEWQSFEQNLKAKYLGAVTAWSYPVHDYAAIDATNGPWDTSPWPSEVAYWGALSETGPPSPSVDLDHSISSESNSFVGEYVCHSGERTGTTCGSVTKLGVTGTEEGTNDTIYNLTEFGPICSKGGDSGGPVFAGNTALGLYSASDAKKEQTPQEEAEFCKRMGFYTEITEDTDALGVSVAPRAAPATQVVVSSVSALNGNPGWVTIKGQVHAPSGATVTGKYVNLDLRKWENNEWVTKETLQPTVTNNQYEVNNWKVGNGQWMARVVFPEQAPFSEGHSDASTEGFFEIKDGYRLVAKHSGKCLDVIGASYENGALMDQWECANPQTAQGQVFTLVPQGEYFQLLVRKSGRCLDVPGASQSDGVQLQQYTCLGVGQANQLWKLITVETVGGVNYFKLTAKHSGKCLDVAGGGTANGAKVQQWGCNGQNQQKWSFQSVESPAPATETTATIPPNGTLNGQPGYVTVNGKVQAGAYPLAGKSLNVNYSKETSPGVWTYMNTSHPTLNSEGAYSYPNWQVAAGNWRVRTVFPGGEGLAESVSGFQYFTIKSGYRFVWRHSGKCMTLSENSGANGKPIIQWPCFSPPSPGDGQVFTLVPFANGYEIKINSTGKCVDVTNVSTANGAKLQQWDCLGAGQTNQIWSLVELAGQPGWFAFIAKHSGRCAEVPQSSTANGAWFQQWDCNWTGNQQFAIQAIN
jgi:hypothetical protein